VQSDVIKIIESYWQKWTVRFKCLYLLNVDFVIVLKHTRL